MSSQRKREASQKLTQELNEIKVSTGSNLLKQHQKEVQNVEETVRKTKAKMHQLKGDYTKNSKSLKHENEELQAQCKTSVTQINELKAENQLLKERLSGEWVKKSQFDRLDKSSEVPNDTSILQTKLNILMRNNENLMKQLNLVLDHPSSSLSPSASTLQAKIEHLKSKLAAEQTEKDSLKQNISNYKSKLAELKKSKFGSQSPEPEPTVARAYTTIRSSRKVLSRVEVEGPLKEAYQKYSLKGAIEDKASEADSEAEEDTSVTPVIGRRQKKSRPARFSIKSKPSTDKGKQQAPNTTDSSDSEDVVSANDVESDTSRMQDLYSRKGIRSGWTAKEQKMVRTQLHEMLNVRRSKDIVGRDGIETKDPDRLALLEKDPNKYGPKIHCSFLDTSGSTIDDLMDSDWNQWFILTLGNMCKAIADASRDPDRFMKMDWQALARDKVYRACLDIVKLKPQLGIVIYWKEHETHNQDIP
ncbi:hypothetical protein GYMLUDRAFT_250655 [Collybiopsis luxurians FD-317 M1]|uniref:Uncharacterized protein n=1 Tax=Collybiopsis luxurians FD-317 M1 TaxID=944289 RepID=A0A0D0BEP1_9AGAR|nr:hypothetical protein GYMLUDRAFT_250655 [Collybiopsis luxurians FD-317 M1]